MTECFIVAMPSRSGLPKPEKAMGGKIFFDLDEAGDFQRIVDAAYPGVQIFRCTIEVTRKQVGE